MTTWTREVAEQIATQRRIPVEQAEAIVTAAEGLWQALEVPGFVDAFGGAEFMRIFPEVIEAIHREANPLAHNINPITGVPG